MRESMGRVAAIETEKLPRSDSAHSRERSAKNTFGEGFVYPDCFSLVVSHARGKLRSISRGCGQTAISKWARQIATKPSLLC